VLTSAYTNYFNDTATSYLLWYFSGYIVSECYKYKINSLKTY